jgi:hypothetical protein
MTRCIVPFALAGALAVGIAFPASADAAYLKRFTVRDSGSRITWAVTVCTSGTSNVRKFRAYLDPESQGITYWRSWGGGRTGPGCDRWPMRTSDIWSEQVWYSQLTVVMRNGQILRTPEKAFYID